MRYADDFVIGFREESKARRCLAALKERMPKFGLELHPEKTRPIEFGRYAEQRRAQRGEGRPEAFGFLGFTHISGKTRRGDFTIHRKTELRTGPLIHALPQARPGPILGTLHQVRPQGVAHPDSWLLAPSSPIGQTEFRNLCLSGLRDDGAARP